jgi:hypothetical protein
LGKSPEATPRISRRLIPKWSPNMASTGFMTDVWPKCLCGHTRHT